MLSVRKLSAGYGSIEIIREIDLDVAERECVALIGWSGCGKTTLMKAIAGLLPPASGKIVYEEADVTREPAHTRVSRGLAMVPEGRHLFAGMSVYENLLVGAHATRAAETTAQQEALIFDLFPVLKARRNQIAGTLSGGEQQMCAIGRALMSGPRLLLIDELSLGLAPIVVARLVEVLRELRSLGTTILVVEQDAALALAISDRAYIMQRGRIELDAPSPALRADQRVQRDFLGLQLESA